MGRHARGAARSRAPVATVGLGWLIVVIIALGSWLGSRTDAAAAGDTVAASAVVVTSPACSAGSGQTLVDVLTTVEPPSGGTPVRATLDACGYQEGQQLAVRYHAGDPAGASLVDPAAASTATGTLLPLGLAVAGLLAVGAALAVYADGRRRPLRHTFGADEPARDRSSAGLPGSGDIQRLSASQRIDDAANPGSQGPTPDASDGAATGPAIRTAVGRHAAPSPDGATLTTAAPGSFPVDPRLMQFPDHNGHGPFTASQARAMSAADDDSPSGRRGDGAEERPAAAAGGPLWTPQAGAHRPEISSLDLIFPYSSTLAASLHDELFTHRTVSG